MPARSTTCAPAAAIVPNSPGSLKALPQPLPEGGAGPALRGCDSLHLQLCCFIQTSLSLCHSESSAGTMPSSAKLQSAERRTPRIFPLPCGIREFSRDILIEPLRTGVGQRDDLSLAYAGRLTRSLQKITASEQSRAGL